MTQYKKDQYSGKKAGVISLGCPKNLVDSEIMLGFLTRAGFEITNKKEEADILIVNTCAFIESAKKESIDTILEMAECKKQKCRLLIVAGCLVERYRDELKNAIPEADVFIGTGGYAEIVNAINKAYSSGRMGIYPNLDNIAYLENNRILSPDKAYAYLKISEGCNNRCNYCIIPSVRGRYRSRRMRDIVNEAEVLANLGKKEIILISQDTTSYGIDRYRRKSLVKLIKKISGIDGIKWIRLLYCYPEEIDEELIQEFIKNEKLCRYLDIPIQHISNKILKSMGRRDTKQDIESLIQKLRKNIPDIIIRTSLIVGFPGETEKDFKELYNFIKKIEFDRLGVFTYSMEEGTKAAEMSGQVKKRTKEKRFHVIMQLQDSINVKKNNTRIEEVYEIIVEGKADKGLYYGRTYAEAPDIDWIVYFRKSGKLSIGDIVKAEIIDIR